MGRVAEKVKIDVEYVESFRRKHDMNAAQFPESLGFNVSWWSKNRQIGYIKPNVAKLMCTIYPTLDYNKLVIPEEKPVEPVAEEASPSLEEEYLPLIAAAMSATSNALHEVKTALERLNEKMDTMLALWQ